MTVVCLQVSHWWLLQCHCLICPPHTIASTHNTTRAYYTCPLLPDVHLTQHCQYTQHVPTLARCPPHTTLPVHTTRAHSCLMSTSHFVLKWSVQSNHWSLVIFWVFYIKLMTTQISTQLLLLSNHIWNGIPVDAVTIRQYIYTCIYIIYPAPKYILCPSKIEKISNQNCICAAKWPNKT